MLLLLVFSFIAGVVTILSPCILPILPIVLSSSFGQGKHRPLGIVFGFVASFTFFTLFLTTIVKLFGVPADTLRIFSVVVIFLFGASLIFSGFQKVLERVFSFFSQFTPRSENKKGFWGGVVVGLSIGLLWTPCVGPILASVISLALTGSVTFEAFLITLSYSLGTAIPMLVIIYSGQSVFLRSPGLLKNTSLIQKIFGFLMIVTAVGIYFNIDRKFQAYILEKFPNYGVGLTRFEENDKVKEELKNINSRNQDESIGKTTNEMFQEANLAPEIIPSGIWFNTDSPDGIFLKDLRGKVVLVDFWTYTCINCIRTLPYLKSWYEKYKDDGLVIVGVHTPEFEFEKSVGNVQKAINDFEIKYPVVQDNEYATWRAYNNRYWPAKYLIDKDGKIRYTHFGEGKYDETEKVIQNLLAETGVQISAPVQNPTYQIQSKTPELYVGSDRYEAGYLEFNGKWSDYGQYRTGTPPNTSLSVEFNAKDVYLVMRPQKNVAEVELYLDGEKITEGNSGADVKDSKVKIVEHKTYHLVHLIKPGPHKLEIKIIDVFSVEFYAFTFG